MSASSIITTDATETSNNAVAAVADANAKPAKTRAPRAPRAEKLYPAEMLALNTELVNLYTDAIKDSIELIANKTIAKMSGAIKDFHAAANSSRVAETKDKKRKRKSRPDGFPKQPVNGFFRYSKENMDTIKTKYGITVHKEFTEKVSDLWRNLTNEEKQPYIDAFVREKKEYDRLVKAWNETHGENISSAIEENKQVEVEAEETKETAAAAPLSSDLLAAVIDTAANTVDAPASKKQKRAPSKKQTAQNTAAADDASVVTTAAASTVADVAAPAEVKETKARGRAAKKSSQS